MKRNLLAVCISFLVAFAVHAQQPVLLSWTPDFPVENDNAQNLIITVDAAKGNQGLYNFTSFVYVHIGVITSSSTSSSDWKYVKYTWASTNVQALCTDLGGNKWQYTIAGSLRTYFGVAAGETILKIAILFRNADGSKVQRNSDASDMYIPVYTANQLYVRFNQPPVEPRYTPVPEPVNVNIGQNLFTRAVSSKNANLSLFLNGTSIATTTAANTISANPLINQNCSNQLIAVADDNGTIKRDTLNFFVAPATATQALPTGVQDGINYETDPTAVTLVLYAPNKTNVLVLGDFNNYQFDCNYLMKRTADGNRYWLRITGLQAGRIYSFQYLVDGAIKIADPYTELILDPNNDPSIPATTYPSIPAYPAGMTSGIVGTLRTAATPYNFTAGSYIRPDKKSLVIYELLLRDFLALKNWQTLTDTLNYIKNLGINAIELMPFNEFEGNESWGYNPDFYFAPDKSYGTKQNLQRFIDSAHKKGIAVIMDIAFNHTTGSSPLAQLYWNSATSQPAASSPYLNVTATHPFSVFNDFNHVSEATKYHVARFIRHWLTEYRIDGFRWDLSKGFTQTNCGSDLNCWNQYDASRVAIWQRYYDSMQAVSAGSYCILEHLGNDDEEAALADRGMLLWGKMTDQFNQNTMGFPDNSGIDRAYYKNRSFWNQPHLVAYAESHDEERIIYKNLVFGNNTNSNHNVRTLPVALKRGEPMAAFLLMIPGPKMIWQFGELGYDFSINRCIDGSVNANCRLDAKPVRWDYYQDVSRRRLYDIYASLNNLRKQKPNAFLANSISGFLGSGNLNKQLIINHPDLSLVLIANFNVNASDISVTFPLSGTWYDYLNGGTFSATGGAQTISLAPGDYRLYLNQNITGGQVVTGLNDIISRGNDFTVKIYPNPVSVNSVIEYEIQQSSHVQMNVMDFQGKRIANIFSGNKLKGKYQLLLYSNGMRMTNLPAGNYLLQVRAGNSQKVLPFAIAK